MDLIFADDAVQNKPTRPRMGPLYGIGGIHIQAKHVRDLERQLDAICQRIGFPDGEEFKWSPGRELWMARNLIDVARRDFFVAVIKLLIAHDVKAIVVIEDSSRGRATTDDCTPLMDVARLFLERVDNQLRRSGRDGLVIVDWPPGDRAAEKTFLADCLDTLQHGTRYVKPQRIALNVLSTHSKMVRLLQAADLVTSCSIATVSGEHRFSPPIFNELKRLFYEDGGRIGGVGLKLHPDLLYVNLYHWLVGDTYYRRGNTGWELPKSGHFYVSSPDVA
jgi:hypothetical protein